MEALATASISTSEAKDALQAVKLDPAVLEAHVSSNSDGKQSPKAQAKAALQQSPVPVPAACKLDSQKNMKSVEDEKPSPNITENRSTSPKSCDFEDMMKKHEAALLSLSPTQFSLLLKYAETLRLQRLHNQKHLECAFCKNNGEPASWYSLHSLKDNRGRVRCPVLRGYRCRACGATGDSAHTIKYCPLTDRDPWSSGIKW